MSFLPFLSLETWTLLVTFICLFVTYGYWTFGVFEKLGVPGPKPYMYWGTIARHHNVYYIDDTEAAKKYGRVWGMYELRRPLLFVMEPDLLRSILVKECFTYFTNRRNFGMNGDLHDAVSVVEDDEWRRIRNILTPSFTSGRIKEMFTITKLHSRKLAESLKSKAVNEEVIQIKDFFGCFSVDAMSSCAYSVDPDSINNPSGPFMAHARRLFRVPILPFMLQGCFPFIQPLYNLLGVTMFQKAATSYFKSVLGKIRTERKENSSQKPRDILQHMINSQTAHESSKDKQSKGLTDHEIFSQATIFLFAGYETSATTLAFLAYTLATNPHAMERLQNEIDATFPDKGEIQYEALMQMEYLDGVVNECLRLYPPAARLERMTKETIQIGGLTIPKDMTIQVPVYALHRDPELWPQPQDFNPDRFSKENRDSIRPYSYLPFGVGPRNCLGMRFALVMVKLALVEVLQTFSFSACEETEIPLQMNPEGLVGPLRPIKLKVVERGDVSSGEI